MILSSSAYVFVCDIILFQILYHTNRSLVFFYQFFLKQKTDQKIDDSSVVVVVFWSSKTRLKMDQKRRYQNGFYSPIIYGQCTPTKKELFLENAHIHRMMIQDHQKQNRNRKTNKTKRTPFSFCC